MTRLAVRLGVVAVVVAGLALLRGPEAAEEKGDLPPDLARVSGKAAGMVSLRPADLWNNDLGKAIRAKLGKDADCIPEEMTRGLGLEPAAIERLTVVYTTIGPGGPSGVTYIAATKAIDRKAMLKKALPGGEEMTHAGQAYFSN